LPHSILPTPAAATPVCLRRGRSPGGAPAFPSSPHPRIQPTSIALTSCSLPMGGTRVMRTTPAGTSPGQPGSSLSSTPRSGVFSALPAWVDGARAPRSMKQAARVDDDGLAGHGFGATHRDHHLGAIVLVGGLL